MENLRKEQKEEAIKRMKMLKIYGQTIKEFEKEDILYKSEHGGILYWLDEDEQQIVREFEEKFGAVVYHVILNYTSFGKMYSLLYVSKYKDEWEYDIDDINQNVVCAYVKNMDDDSCSEFGSIGVKSLFGGLARTC